MDWEEDLLSHTILKVGEYPVYTIYEVTKAFNQYDISFCDTLTIVVAPHVMDEKFQSTLPPQIATNQLWLINSILQDGTQDSDPPVLLPAFG